MNITKHSCINFFAAKTRHNIHTFESRLPKSKHQEDRENFVITKREKDTKRPITIKRYDISATRNQKAETTSMEKSLKTPKNVIETTNGYGHLSELLGLKGSFIPSQSRQHWVQDEGDPETNEFHSYSQQPGQHHMMNGFTAEKGTLPIDISPQQAALISATADSNSQRQKFLQWEKQGGSMDTKHFPSTFIKGERSVDSIDSEASKRVSTEQAPTREQQNDLHSQNDAIKQNDAKYEDSKKEPTIYNDIGMKDKKGYMGYLNNQFGLAEEGHRINGDMMQHNFLGSTFHSSNDQPLTHEMINKLQLDPAWDAMEAKILRDHGRKVVPLQLPESKIDREMMPPIGEPVGQAYLPNHQQLHDTLLNNFHKAAGFSAQPLRADLHPSSYYSHFQPTDQNMPQTLNIGGSLGNMLHSYGIKYCILCVWLS